MPAAPWIVPSLLLVLALAVSAAFKLRDPRTTEDAFISLRLPAWLRSMRGPLLLPYGELVLAAGLLFVPSPVFSAVAVLVVLLFVAYLVVVTRALRFEEPVHCNCFGKLGLGEIDRRTVVRNVLLVVASVLTLVDGLRGGSMIGRFGHFDAAEWAWTAGVLAAVLLTGIVVYGGGRPQGAHPQFAASSDEDDLDYIRQPIPYGMLLDSEGQPHPLAGLPMSKPVLLVAVSLGCGACHRTMEAMPSWAQENPMLRTIFMVVGDQVPSELPVQSPHVEWMADPAATVTRTLALSFPSAVLLGMDGLLAGGPVLGYDAIMEFTEDIHAELEEAREQQQEAGRQALGAALADQTV